jgi:acetyl-CoA C-acetyltransferase
MENVYIVSAARTAVGSFQGTFAQMPAPRLGAAAIKEAVLRSGLSAADIQECIMGNVLTAGIGQAPARQAALFAGLPNSTECLTIGKVCGSGLKAVMLGMQAIQVGDAQVIVAGGQENMTLAPHVLEKSRSGYRMGHVQMIDSMIQDGLWDPYNNLHMGSCAEACAREYKFTREAQDAFARSSYERAQAAQKAGLFKNEIVVVETSAGKETVRVEHDEDPGKARFEKMAGLKPAFDKDGTITAANASKINDGAAALVLASESVVKAKNLQPLARLVSQASFAQEPKWFTTAPVGAVKKALAKAKWTAESVDLFEINEAFALVTMAAIQELHIDAARVNVNGGAIAIGHPIGASGARILTTLLYAMQAREARRGVATLCIGGGEGAALCVERV